MERCRCRWCAAFEPGEFILVDGKLKITGGGARDDTGVSFYLTDNQAEVDISGSGDIHLSAPETGPLAGFVFYQDPNANSGTASKPSGQSELYCKGANYIPTQKADVSGGAFVEVPPITIVVANELNFSGGTEFFFNFALNATNVPLPSGLSSQGARLLR